ncbi:hypothetical protein JTE88_07215 [Arcanobacterium phocisimile]|uniref:Secreted protein n=1 Tax=Arcanobacterium phocisimile TaxID=1302235 RepID=A0ABX7IJ41_9ACTO|nr:DUF5719 family protein [Arcanobacterium phocisimile]QRV01868.1 hypothetical protein JTE88_07215 [Arcanobacterium phocisimile]
MKFKPLVSAIAILALAGGVVVGGLAMKPIVHESVEPTRYLPEGQTFALACTPGLRRTVEEGVNVTQEAESVLAGASVFVHNGQWFDNRSQTLTSPPTISATRQDFAPELGAGTVLTSSSDVSAKRFMGGSYARIGGGDMRGLAVNPCQWTRQSMWLVGSKAQTGTYNVVSIANPGQNPITVTLTAYGERGQVDLTSSQQIAIAPQSTTELNMDGLIPDTQQLALHLSSDSGTFAATMQTNELEGFTPSGVSVISNSEIATKIVIPGIVVPEKVAADASIPAEERTATLRIVNPHADELTAQISLIGETEQPLPGTPEVTVPAQSVLDLTLDGLPAGTYAVQISADQPMTASAEIALASGGASDHAWIASQTPIRAGGAAIGVGDARLIAVSPDESEVTVTGYDETGKETYSTTERLSGTQMIDIAPGTHFVWLDSSRLLNVGVEITTPLNNGTGIAYVPLVSQGAQDQAITISVGP